MKRFLSLQSPSNCNSLFQIPCPIFLPSFLPPSLNAMVK